MYLNTVSSFAQLLYVDVMSQPSGKSIFGKHAVVLPLKTSFGGKNVPDIAPAKTAVIYRSSPKLVTGTFFDPSFSIAQLLTGTYFRPVWSKLMMVEFLPRPQSL